MIRCNSEADSIVWMKEDMSGYVYPDGCVYIGALEYLYSRAFLRNKRMLFIFAKNVHETTTLKMSSADSAELIFTL